MTKFNDRITNLLSIKYPIIQGGMVWVSGGKLAAAVANSGALGLIGAGSMKPELLKEHIKKAQSLITNDDGNLGINVPLLYDGAKEQIQVALDCGVKIFFTSAGSPKKFTHWIKDSGAYVIHVTSSPELAIKCEQAGVDAVVAEGFEAGGHNGRDEATTLVLIPQVRDAISIPLICAGGIYDGRQMAAAACLGADAVQIGSGFAATVESSAHDLFKDKIIEARFGATRLLMKKHVPVRLLDNDFAREVTALEEQGATKEELEKYLGKGRAKAGMLKGDIVKGELEIGQVSSMIKSLPTAAEYIESLMKSYLDLVAP